MRPTREQVESAIIDCIQNAVGSPNDQVYACTWWHGHIEQRVSLNALTYSIPEYFGHVGHEVTFFQMRGVDIDPAGEYRYDEETGLFSNEVCNARGHTVGESYTPAEVAEYLVDSLFNDVDIDEIMRKFDEVEE